jgi:hypothetical protein
MLEKPSQKSVVITEKDGSTSTRGYEGELTK